MKQFYPLSTFLTEYSEKNGVNAYRPVAVGRYGIRTRESIYSKELAKDYSKNKLIHKNTLTVGMGSVQIDIGVLTDDITYSVSPAYHTYKIAGVNAEYLRYCLECRNQDMFSRFVKRGSRQGKTIDLKRWMTYEIPVYDENRQQEIVDRLNRISELIEKRQEQLVQLSELVKSRFIELFGDPQRNPHGYKHTKLSDIATYYNGLTYKPENVAAEGTIVLRSSNIQNSQLDFADTIRVDCAIKERLMVQKNDILMCSRNGSAKLVGKVALIKDIQEPMSFGAFMMIIRSHYFGYLMTYFQMDAFRQQIKTGATTTINQITGRMLDDVTIPLPPMALVDQFAAFVEQTDKSKYYSSLSFRYCQAAANTYRQEWMTCRTSDF